MSDISILNCIVAVLSVACAVMAFMLVTLWGRVESMTRYACDTERRIGVVESQIRLIRESLSKIWANTGNRGTR